MIKNLLAHHHLHFSLMMHPWTWTWTLICTVTMTVAIALPPLFQAVLGPGIINPGQMDINKHLEMRNFSRGSTMTNSLVSLI
jgi:hypothetical protein